MKVRVTPSLLVVVLAMVIWGISGCTGTQPTASAPSPTTKALQIISNPPGARIEINNNYVGDAPLTVQIPVSHGQYNSKTITVRAIPIINGQYVQTKYFSDYYAEVPDRLFFEMSLVPASGQ